MSEIVTSPPAGSGTSASDGTATTPSGVTACDGDRGIGLDRVVDGEGVGGRLAGAHGASVQVLGTSPSGRASPPSSTDVVGTPSMVRVIARSTTIESTKSVPNTMAWRPSGRPATSSDVYVTSWRAGTTIGSTSTSEPPAIPRNTGVTSTSSSVGL